MREFLVFQLFGPLASWGEEAVGDVRPSAARPTRSALLGLIGAALGIERGDDAGQADIAASMRFAVAVVANGVPLIDYHTIQTRQPRRGRSFASRAEQLGALRHDLTTLLSERHYRCDARYRVVAWQPEGSRRWGLEAVESALLAPRFPLYLGRKSCPPALPLAPRRVVAETLLAALEAAPDPATGLCAPGGNGEPVWLFWEEERELAGVAPLRITAPRDEPRSRRPWTFERRPEHAAVLP